MKTPFFIKYLCYFGKQYLKGGTLAQDAVHLNFPFMRLDDPVGERQADSPVPGGGLGGKEGSKYFFNIISTLIKY